MNRNRRDALLRMEGRASMSLKARLVAIAAALAISLLIISGTAARALFGGTGLHPIEEVPIERLLQNLETQRDKVEAFDYWSVVARIHLLAYIRQTVTLPADVPRGTSADQAVTVDDGPFIGCKPIVVTLDNPDGSAEKCTTDDRQIGYPARPGLPEGTLSVRHPVNEHLNLALAAYEKVKQLDPARLRPRLALAYVYDRLGRTDDALLELRFIIDTATDRLPAISPERSDDFSNYWEFQIIATEAIEHLMSISRAQEDNDRINALLPKLKTPKKQLLYMTPILVPLTKAAPIEVLTNAQAQVPFDLTGQRLPLTGGWITKDAAWLVWDPSNKQKIESGFQLFGSVTWMTPWENGYLPLAVLDDNGDGRVAGRELDGLSLWHDVNVNGISEKGEVKPVTDWQIVSLGYRHQRKADDLLISKDGVTFANGETRATYDWSIRTQLLTADAKPR